MGRGRMGRPEVLDMHVQVRFFNTLQAFQAFAGRPLKVLDAADTLSHAELEVMDQALLRMAKIIRTLEYKSQDEKENANCKRLSDRCAETIEKWVGKTYTELRIELEEQKRV